MLLSSVKHKLQLLILLQVFTKLHKFRQDSLQLGED